MWPRAAASSRSDPPIVPWSHPSYHPLQVGDGQRFDEGSPAAARFLDAIEESGEQSGESHAARRARQQRYLQGGGGGGGGGGGQAGGARFEWFKQLPP